MKHTHLKNICLALQSIQSIQTNTETKLHKNKTHTKRVGSIKYTRHNIHKQMLKKTVNIHKYKKINAEYQIKSTERTSMITHLIELSTKIPHNHIISQ